ncbi:hypothetical protein HMPREF9733_00245 [Treponema denticola SP33]|uniref:Uncharacterized protein n=1 Tax=Treponema denticola SP33 TaxID=999437 RepID=M2AVD1_TREDN|nr:hypothetical protein HMPREF9733_00245 [Treponema denticola SP33]EPF36295.1 hypothetical protein HMPREF9732_01660 [Treponema denticola SP32]
MSTANRKYSRRLLKIPTPEFYVFYNGEDPYPSNKTLKLSDAFIEKPIEANLELTVKIININRQNRHPVLQNCKTMQEYSIFVETVRKWKEIDTQTGFQKAVEECLSIDVHPCTSIEGKFVEQTCCCIEPPPSVAVI